MKRTPIIPPSMQNIVTTRGYLPGLQVGGFIFIAGQVGRTADMQIVTEPAAQFEQCFENLRTVLAEAGCTLDDIVDVTTYHVEMAKHYPAFRDVKNRIFPTAMVPWTAIGVSALADPAFLLEVKATACLPG